MLRFEGRGASTWTVSRWRRALGSSLPVGLASSENEAVTRWCDASVAHTDANGTHRLSARAPHRPRSPAVTGLLRRGGVGAWDVVRTSQSFTRPRTVESAGRPLGRYTRLPSGRFHGLFNSLFKVLFNFPTRYLFAVGLAVISIASLRWGLPPT